MRILIFRLKCSSKSKRKLQVVETPTFFPMRHFCLAFSNKMFIELPLFHKNHPCPQEFLVVHLYYYHYYISNLFHVGDK